MNLPTDLVYRSVRLPTWLDNELDKAASRSGRSVDEVLELLLTPIFKPDDDDEVDSTVVFGDEDDE